MWHRFSIQCSLPSELSQVKARSLRSCGSPYGWQVGHVLLLSQVHWEAAGLETEPELMGDITCRWRLNFLPHNAGSQRIFLEYVQNLKHYAKHHGELEVQSLSKARHLWELGGWGGGYSVGHWGMQNKAKEVQKVPAAAWGLWAALRARAAWPCPLRKPGPGESCARQDRGSREVGSWTGTGGVGTKGAFWFPLWALGRQALTHPHSSLFHDFTMVSRPIPRLTGILEIMNLLASTRSPERKINVKNNGGTDKI